MADEETVTAIAPSSSVPVESIEVENPLVKTETAGEDADNTKDEVPPSELGASDKTVTTDQYKALKAVAEAIYNYSVKKKDEEDYYPSLLFRSIPNRRNLPDYYEIIKEPSAISTLKKKLQRRELSSVPEFVRDFALIVHNAQVYNRPNSSPVRDVLLLKDVFEQEMKALVAQGLVSEADTIFPDLGEIPSGTPEPDQVSEEEEEGDEEGSQDDEDEDADDSEEERRRRKRGKRASLAGKKAVKDDEEEGGKANDADARKRRGRPPKVDTPMESRIKAILKGMRKPKTGELLKIRHFERLPDKSLYPHYYQEIKNPMALDMIKKKAKRKKYASLEHFMSDLNLMFNNAMEYNEDNSDICKDAIALKSEAQALLEVEKAKPDDEYSMEDGRLPLPNGISHKNEIWKVGDWIHLQNPNDVTKPIVAQIYRTWQDPDGEKWINACWYYRPEQTIHQFEKHFYPNEVVKTGQYRDHRIDEVIDKCFVMFFTRYSRGRPRNLDDSIEVYVCECRYNEEKSKLNKIKTWASCLPDEVRDKDYEMDLYSAPRKIKKVPSPLLHLLKDDAKSTDELPQPEWGHPNAPPKVGGIHRQARDENQSPPPEPTPPPPPTPPPQPVRAPSTSMQNRPSIDLRPNVPNSQQQPPRLTPSITPQLPGYHAASASATPSFGRGGSYQDGAVSHPYASRVPATPSQHQPLPYATQQLHSTPSLGAAHPTSYAGLTPAQGYGRPQLAPAQSSQVPGYAVTNAQPARPAEVYVLAEGPNSAIPKTIRDQFPQDAHGRILFFTTPPVDSRQEVTNKESMRPEHSAAYLAMKREITEKHTERKRPLTELDAYPNKHLKQGSFGSEQRDPDGRIKADPGQTTQAAVANKSGAGGKLEQKTSRTESLAIRALSLWREENEAQTEAFYKQNYGEQWRKFQHADTLKAEKERTEFEEERKQKEQMRKSFVNPTEKITQISQSPWTGIYLDDQDPRYGF